MTLRNLLIIGAVGLMLILIVGTVIGIRSNSAGTAGVASVGDATWYQNAGTQPVAGVPAQYVSGVQGQAVPSAQSQYVLAQQALPAPVVRTEYVTVPAPVIVGPVETDTTTRSTTASTRTVTSGSGTVTNMVTTSGAYTAPYETFAQYEARYYATHPQAPGAPYPTYQTAPVGYGNPAYPSGYAQPQCGCAPVTPYL